MRLSRKVRFGEPRRVRPVLAGFWVLGFFLLCSPQTATAKPQISIDCAPNPFTVGQPIGFCLWYNTYQAAESTWDTPVYMDAYASDGTELSGYPVDLGNNFTTVSTTDACTSGTSGCLATQPAPAANMVVYSASGDWNGASCYALAGDNNQYYSELRYYQHGRRCIPYWCTYAVARTVTPPTDWSVQILGKVPKSGSNVEVTLDVAGTTGHQIQFSYTVVTKTSDDASTISPVATSGHAHQQLVNPKAAKPRGGYIIPAVAAVGDKSASLEIHDLVVAVPAANYVYIDIVAVNVNEGNSITLPRFQLYP